MEYDVFISHASEDKVDVARPLSAQLETLGLTVWIDDMELTLGDSLRRKIDKGLAQSRFGVVILSESFFRKEWPQKELDGLTAKENDGKKVILPVRHKLKLSSVKKHSPLLAGKVCISTDEGINQVAIEVLRSVQKELRVAEEGLRDVQIPPKSLLTSVAQNIFTPWKFFLLFMAVFILYQNQWFQIIHNGWYFEIINGYPYDKCNTSVEETFSNRLVDMMAREGNSVTDVIEKDHYIEKYDNPGQDYINAFFGRARFLVTIAFFEQEDEVHYRVWFSDREGDSRVKVARGDLKKLECPQSGMPEGQVFGALIADRILNDLQKLNP